MKPSDVSLVALSNTKFEHVAQRQDSVNIVGDTTYVGDPTEFGAYKQNVITGECERFDLENTEDRKRYAELSARLIQQTDYIKVWEERIPNPNGSLIVYVNYVKRIIAFQSSRSPVEFDDTKR